MKLRMVACAVLALLVLAPAHGAESCRKLTGFWLTLTPTPHGYLVPMSVNGTPHLFLLNLGDAFAILDKPVVDILDLPTQRLHIDAKIEGAPVTRLATAKTIQLGPLSRKDAQFIILPDGTRRDNPQADGVIGVNVLAGFDLELDLAHNKLGLFLPDHCPFVPYWPYSVMGSAPFRVTPTGLFEMPMTLDGKNVIADFETSEPMSYLNGTAASMLFGIDPSSGGAIAAANAPDGMPLFRFPFKTLSAGGVTINNPQLFVSPDDHKPCGGVAGNWFNASHNGTECWGSGDILLGIPELKKLHFFFDFKAHTVYFTPAEG